MSSWPWASLCGRRWGLCTASRWADSSSALKTAGSPPWRPHNPGGRTKQNISLRPHEGENVNMKIKHLMIRPLRWRAAFLCVCRDELTAAAGWLWSDQSELHWCDPEGKESTGTFRQKQNTKRWSPNTYNNKKTLSKSFLLSVYSKNWVFRNFLFFCLQNRKIWFDHYDSK